MNNLGKMLDTQEITNDDIERAAKFQLFARAVQPPTRKESMLEYRFVLRIAQFIFALASLLSLMLASLRFNYSSSSIAMSGFELTCTTSVFSLVYDPVEQLFLISS